MGTQTYTVSLTFPIPIFPAGLQAALMLTNSDTANTVYVNDIANANGTAIGPGSTLTWDKGKPLYAYVLGGPVALVVLQNDGAITSPPIIAPGTITAVAIAAGTITGDKLSAGTITGDKLSATSIDGKTITGALIRTAANGQRWELSTAPSNMLQGFTGNVSEATPGGIASTVVAGRLETVVYSPTNTGGSGAQATIEVFANPTGNGTGVSITAAGTSISGTLDVAQTLTSPNMPRMYGMSGAEQANPRIISEGRGYYGTDGNGDLRFDLSHVFSSCHNVHFVSSQGNGGMFAEIMDITVTNFTIRIRNAAGAPIVNSVFSANIDFIGVG